MSTALNSIFCASPERNGLQFHQIYGLLHDLLRERFGAKIFDLYKLGGEALAEQAMKNGVLRSTILVGTSDSLEIMKEKLSGIAEGFSIAETKYHLKHSNFVRLTFTRNREGTVINCSPTSLTDLLQFLEKEPKLDSRIDGFDFCGFENPKNLAPTYDYLALLSEHNVGRVRHNLSPYTISVHAGENCLDWQSIDHLDAFTNLLRYSWDLVGHGTFLWLPHQLLSLSLAENRMREELLLVYAKSGKTFEICPTANMLLTPMESGSDFPLASFVRQNIPFSVNTDNSTLFSTTPSRERRLIGLR